MVQAISNMPSSSVGGFHSRNGTTAMGSADAYSQGRRRPRRLSVRSDRNPAMGSDTASQMRAAPKISPMAAGAIKSTSVAYLKKYRFSR